VGELPFAGTQAARAEARASVVRLRTQAGSGDRTFKLGSGTTCGYRRYVTFLSGPRDGRSYTSGCRLACRSGRTQCGLVRCSGIPQLRTRESCGDTERTRSAYNGAQA
jgi:hypothetical protein